jgi:hypothetical protein
LLLPAQSPPLRRGRFEPDQDQRIVKLRPINARPFSRGKRVPVQEDAMRKLAAPLLAISFSLIGAAWAHTPYIKPSAFRPTGAVEAEAAYSTDIFTPVAGFPAQGLSIIDPDGRELGFAQVNTLPSMTELQANLASDGTYRLTTGEQYGAVTQMIFDHGHWRALGAGEHAPRGARTSTLQMVVQADAYVTRGAPTRTAVDQARGRLAIHAITDPNSVTVTSGLDLDLLFNGEPFAYMPFVVYAPGQSEDDMSRVFVTNEHGRAHLRFDRPGVYLAVVRYRAPAPPRAGVRVYSYSTSITFEVLPAEASARAE